MEHTNIVSPWSWPHQGVEFRIDILGVYPHPFAFANMQMQLLNQWSSTTNYIERTPITKPFYEIVLETVLPVKNCTDTLVGPDYVNCFFPSNRVEDKHLLLAHPKVTEEHTQFSIWPKPVRGLCRRAILLGFLTRESSKWGVIVIVRENYG